MRLDKLAKQLNTHDREQRRHGQLAATRLRQQIADADRKLKLQIQALEDGVDPDLVQARITELKTDQATYQNALAELDPDQLRDETGLDPFSVDGLGRLVS